MRAGGSKAATMIKQSALAPSPQPRPAPTARALPSRSVAQGGQNWTPIRGQIWKPIDSFVERGAEDRHSFRFIVAPEDGDRLADLRGFTRDVMNQMEADLGTKLDWVAVDHFITGHPHRHVVIRGNDDLGQDLINDPDYIT